jgi:hypothetical protein
VAESGIEKKQKGDNAEKDIVQTEKPKKEAKIKTVVVQVISPNNKAAFLALPTIGKSLAEFLDKTDDAEFKRGDLPSISEADRKLLGDSIA